VRKTSEILENIIDMIQDLEHLKKAVQDRDDEIGYWQDRSKELEKIIKESGQQNDKKAFRAKSWQAK